MTLEITAGEVGLGKTVTISVDCRFSGYSISQNTPHNIWLLVKRPSGTVDVIDYAFSSTWNMSLITDVEFVFDEVGDYVFFVALWSMYLQIQCASAIGKTMTWVNKSASELTRMQVNLFRYCLNSGIADECFAWADETHKDVTCVWGDIGHKSIPESLTLAVVAENRQEDIVVSVTKYRAHQSTVIKAIVHGSFDNQYQWQESTDKGNTWTDIEDATEETFCAETYSDLSESEADAREHLESITRVHTRCKVTTATGIIHSEAVEV